MYFYDRNTRDVIDNNVLLAIADEAKVEFYWAAWFFDLVQVVRGNPNGAFSLGKECDLCGAPMGRIDPDDARWVKLSLCMSCDE